MAASVAIGTTIDKVTVSAYSIPTDAPEADGTYHWDQTTLILVELKAGDVQGLGYTYAGRATAQMIYDELAPLVLARDVCEGAALWIEMHQKVRNFGLPGVAAMAISAVDIALWDTKAKVLGHPLVEVLGSARHEAPIYGSGGFTSYTTARLCEQLSGWVEQGIPRVKMKVGSEPHHDVKRVQAARSAIGHDNQLFVDANGAYTRKEALSFAEKYAALGVTWFEEPVSADDLEGLRFIRDRAPAALNIAAGEYGYQPLYFRRMLEAGAVDVLQADATRCGGITGFLKAADLCEAVGLPLSAHCAPAVHVHPCCATTANFQHLEYFHDHVRIEKMLFDGSFTPRNGALIPDLTRPGLGLDFKHQDAEKFQIWADERP